MRSLNGKWMLGIDRDNSGREKRWFEKPDISNAQEVNVPCTIQQHFPGYCGVAWYWREFSIKANTNSNYLLRFWAVDYMADVWVNGVYVGGHEGGETPFTLNVTKAIKPGGENLLVVRVLNPGNEPIDGIKLQQTPHRNKVTPYVTGGSYNHGGIMQPVELLCVPSIRINDVFARPEASTGLVRFQTTIQNDSENSVKGSISIFIAPAVGGHSIKTTSKDWEFPSGESLMEMEGFVDNLHLWSLDDPYLYRATARLNTHDESDEQSTRFGFRDFCFKDGYFRLNERRIFLRSAHTGNHYPIGMQLPHDLELLRRDLYYAKTMGFNMVRFIAGVAWPSQLDFCDELGLMVYEESYAGWCLEDSPQMAERFDKSTAEMIRRDRNHPSLVIWGLLNETPDVPVFRHAVNSLPLVRSLDDSRLVLLNSGRWDGKWSIGSISNPGSNEWEHLLGKEAPEAADGKWATGGYLEGAGDAHYYPPIPLSADSIKFFRKLGEDSKHVFLSEHGNGGQVDAVRVIRLYEQAGARSDLEDYLQYSSEADKYLADWESFGMDSIFSSPGDLMLQSQRIQAEQRLVGINAIRSNPNLCGYSITGLCDQGMTAEGLWTTFRELKPGMTEAIREGWEPLRWCLFAEPVHGYRGQTFKLEAVLANEDVLLPGDYLIRFKVVGPDGVVMDRLINLRVTGEVSFVLPVFEDEVKIDGPGGRYEIAAYFERGAAPAGGRTHFFVSEPVEPKSFWLNDTIVTVWEDESQIKAWLEEKGIKSRGFTEPASQSREVILVSKTDGGLDQFRELARRIYQGSTAVFLTPKVFKRRDNILGWLPLATKGELRQTQGWAAGRDDFAKAHPIFDNLPSKGLLDLTYYRDLIPGRTFNGQSKPAEIVAGAFAVGSYQPGGYYSGTHIAVYNLGAGKFVLNTFLILENLGKHPAADRLLLNFLQYGAKDTKKPLETLPDDFDNLLAVLGYC